MEYSQLEIFRAAVQHEYCGYFLFHGGFTPDLEQRVRKATGVEKDKSLGEYFGMYTPVEVNVKPSAQVKKPDFRGYFADMVIPSNAFVNALGVLEIPGSLYHFTRYVSPLRNASTLKEIEDFTYPNADGYTDDHMKAEVEAAHQRGMVTCCSLTHMYEDAWQIRGYVPFLTDMVDHPENCEYVLDQICQRNLKKAVAAARAGVDVLVTGDDVANQKSMMFSPRLWRKFMKTRWAKVYQAARDIKPDIQIWYHSDGNIWTIIPELIEIGVTILNPIQPECLDPLEVKRTYGKRLVLDGTIGTQTTMPFGTPENIRDMLRLRKKELGYDGALILSPTHVLEPDVPVENVLAFVQACRE